MESIKRIKQSLQYIEEEIDKIDNAPERSAIVELIESLEDLDESYRMYCKQLDEEREVEAGTHYTDGVYDDFYIEAELFHEVSLALRKIKELENG